MLAAKLLLEQGVEVKGLIFKSYFFDSKAGEKAAQQLKIPYQVVDFSVPHLRMVKNPPHGYGKAANPCLDCHLLMLKMAKKIMESQDYDFVATGEVLGERPFSQNKKALEIIAEKSGLKDRLLRPLSAQLLPVSLPEKRGWLDRQKLLAIQGRRRQTQLKLAKKYKLKFPQPSGGCILTDSNFGQRLFDLLDHSPAADGPDIQLLFLGRHFWEKDNKIILGKNQEENEKLEKLAQKGDQLVIPKNFPGPTALMRGPQITSQIITAAAKNLILSYSKTSPVAGVENFEVKVLA